ncbi:uncharacterized protein [Nicotiana sylvestris]|uniref:uncharacterized protein n=1 Tax=Nicotiana sylvestris TaxID=4096 RepID=UPI00388C391B
MPESVVPKAKAPMPRPPHPYPQRLAKQNSENQFKKFINIMKSLSINVPLVEALEQMSGYEKFMKDLVTKKRSMNCETIKMTHLVSTIVHSMDSKLEDPGAFTIPSTIGAPILPKLYVNMGRFILLADFVILDCEVDYEVPIILGRPFLATGKAFVDVEANELTFLVGDKKVVLCRSMRQPNSNEVCSFVDLVTDVIIDDASATMNVEDNLEVVLLNLDDDEEKEGYVECVNELQGMGSYTYESRKLSLDLENQKTPLKKPAIEEPPTLELKPLPPYLRYEFLDPSSTLPIILSFCLTNMKVDSTLEVLQRRKRVIGWTLANNRGISPAFCMHKIILEEGSKPSVEHQMMLNEAIQEVVNKEIITWLDVRVVYPVSDSSWTSPVQCVLKKVGMIVVTNDKNELIPTRIVTGWRVCMDYRKLNKVNRKDHFPLPFLDQMLDRLAGHVFYCFLDGYSSYNQILIAHEDQEKTTFTCPYGTFAFSRMPFGLCNPLTTF